MDCDEDESGTRYISALGDEESRNAVNSIILDYYKKIGRKRDLEQYFSLSTANSELRDPTGTFWRKMKSENDSSDSGGKKSDNSCHELCRISIRCSVPDPCSSQEEDRKTKTESVSPPIITEEVSTESGHNSDAESVKSGSIKSEDNNSQKSYDVLLDTSMNKPFSPTSSITSQRKLEWDSLADVGYANESDRKTSASSLSTLERLALIQQYSNNDNQSTNIGVPTAHSTPLDENEPKPKTKKGIGKRSTKIHQKDVDLVEVNVPEHSYKPTQSINVNLTKHISFNVEKDGKVTIENVQKDVSVSPEKVSVETEFPPKPTIDKEIQTSLVKTKEANLSPVKLQPVDSQSMKIPVMISLNTLRKRTRRKKMMMLRKKLKQKKIKEHVVVTERSGEQLSEAESFEYMPGHIYNQNQLQAKEQTRQKDRISIAAGNKSSLESSGALTTDSSKASVRSFSKDLEKSIELLKNTLKDRDDVNLRKQLIKLICERLIKTKYKDDDSSDFLSGFTITSKKTAGDRNFTTTSTSDGNDSGDKQKRPKKSILRNDKFNTGQIASTSQSAPNLSGAVYKDNSAITKLIQQLTTSNTDSELSNKERSSSDNVFAKTSSEELYQKYLSALRREQAYKQHLKDKEIFFKQKLGNSDGTSIAPSRSESKVNSRLKNLINDLTRNNYDDGSGDASKLEGGPNPNTDFDRFLPVRTQRSHSVFTLSSGNSDYQNKKCNLKKRLQNNIKDLTRPGPSREHYCCCPHHSSNNKYGVTDSSVQVNIKIPYDGDSPNEGQRSRNVSPRTEGSPPRNQSRTGSPRHNVRGDCSRRQSGGSPRRSCNDSPRSKKESPSKESRNSPREIKCYCLCGTKPLQEDSSVEHQCVKPCNNDKKNVSSKGSCATSNTSSGKNKVIATTSKDLNQKVVDNEVKKLSKSSQTNLLIKMSRRQSSEESGTCSCSDEHAKDSTSSKDGLNTSPTYTRVYEATRCLQTEISINPKISEPTLSDVNIVTDSSCAKLISEGCRDNIRPSITDIFSRDTVGFSGSTKSSTTSKNMDELGSQCIAVTDLEAAAPTSGGIILNTPDLTPTHIPILNIVEPSENYEIPIQGTNMTLLVSIDSNERKPTTVMTNHTNNKVSTSVGTDLVLKNEQGTSLAEECTKGVQYDRVQSEEVSVNKMRPNNIICQNTLLANTSFNTYPRSPTKVRPPFRRSTTDTKYLQRSFAETDIFKECVCGCGNTNCDSEVSKLIESKNTETIKVNNKCSCGCKNNIDKCAKDCSERKEVGERSHLTEPLGSVKSQNQKRCVCGCGQQNCNSILCQNSDTKLADLQEKCPCGCHKKKDVCGNTCADCTVRLILDPVDDDSSCPCGCGGTKKNCNNACVSLPQLSKHVLVRKEVGVQKYSPRDTTKETQVNMSDFKDTVYPKTVNNVLRTEVKRMTKVNDINSKLQVDSHGNKYSENDSDPIDPIIEKIQSITNRYSKKDLEKSKRKKCFKEIMNVLSYLLDTEDSIGRNENDSASTSGSSGANSSKQRSDPKIKNSIENTSSNSSSNSRAQESTPCGSPKIKENREKTPCESPKNNKNRETPKCPKNNRNKDYSPPRSPRKSKEITPCGMSKTNSIEESEPCEVPIAENVPNPPPEKPKTLINKGIQSSASKKNKCRPTPTESSDLAYSEVPGTSTDSATCKVLSKIKRECERYHQKRCKVHGGKKCEVSSSTSADCDHCRRDHHCSCRTYKCKSHKKCHHEKCSKKPVAYNLIIQTSDSMMSEDRPCDNKQLKNVVVKVPPKKVLDRNLPFKEIEAKIESKMSKIKRDDYKCFRSRSVPNESEISSLEEIIRKSQGCTVREYLEKNRPDFVKNSSDRLHCLKFISGSRETERAAKRNLLSLYVAQLSNVKELKPDELRQLAKELGRHFRQKNPDPKLISEREMKRHTEKIYKSLPEVVQKKEDAKKENEKKTNLLMASMFKKNLQKKTLSGSVNLSNYSSVIKI